MGQFPGGYLPRKCQGQTTRHSLTATAIPGDLENTRGPKWQPGTPDVPKLQLVFQSSRSRQLDLIPNQISWVEETDLEIATLIHVDE